MSPARMPSPVFLPGLELFRCHAALSLPALPGAVRRPLPPALAGRIKDPDVRELRGVGALDRFIDSADVLSRPDLPRAAVDAVTGIHTGEGPPRRRGAAPRPDGGTPYPRRSPCVTLWGVVRPAWRALWPRRSAGRRVADQGGANGTERRKPWPGPSVSDRF